MFNGSNENKNSANDATFDTPDEAFVLAVGKIVSCWIMMMTLRPIEGGEMRSENGAMPNQHQEKGG